MYFILFALFMVYLLIMSIWGYFDTKKIKDKALTENEKVKNYKEGIIIGWIPVLIFIPLCLLLNISFHDIGFGKMGFTYNTWFTLLTIVICSVSFAYFIYQIISYLTSEKYREKAKAEILKPENKLMYNVVLPRTKKEKKLFFGISLTAGICEEIIFRGLLLYILQGLFPNLSIVFIILIALTLFGIGHLYQGIKGVIQTAIVGAIFCCLFLVTNSLIFGMILHFVMDFSAAFVIGEEKII